MEVLLEVVFFMWSTPTLYHTTDTVQFSYSHVEAGSNTTTVDLQVVGGDKKGTQCLGI
jgi:hypothetical protein